MKRHIRPSPIGALARGLVAGALGSAAQDLFFRLTRKIEPARLEGAFAPPERDQIEENATETVARRVMEGLLQRPLSPAGKARGAIVVHYAFGAALGGMYGLLRETTPALRTPLGTLAYGFGAWMVGDNLVIPTFRLGGWPQAYPLKTHAYALGAHLVYSVAVAASYEALRPRSLAAAAATLWAVRAQVAAMGWLPARARPLARAVIGSAARVRAAEPLTTLAEVARAAA
jgi:hypothetical protein